MQLIFLGAATSPATMPDLRLVFARLGEFAQRPEVHWLLYFYLILAVLGPILNIIWSWLASMIVVRGENASLGNALKYFVATLLLSGALVLGFIFVVPFVIEKVGGAGAMAVIGGFVLLSLTLSIYIPMKIYEIRFFRALGFIVLVIVFSGIGNFAAAFVSAKTFGVEARTAVLANAVGKTDAERRAFIKRLFGADDPDEVNRMLDEALYPIGNPKPQAEREATVQAIRLKLDARLRALASNDTKGLTAFQVQYQRYMRLLNQAKADRAAKLATPKKPGL